MLCFGGRQDQQTAGGKGGLEFGLEVHAG
jgi:hypothetical protein